MRWLPIQGTWGWGRGSDHRWWQNGSPFVAFLAERGFTLLGADDPFVWTTDLNGVWFGDKHIDWQCGGINLRQYIKPPLHAVSVNADDYVPFADRNLITHSHGLQPVLYAAAAGLRIRTLVSVTGPVRDDMMAVAEKARPNIGRWIHLCSDHSDRIQTLGALLDGRFGIVREHPLADQNVPIAGVGHSGLLENQAHFHYWTDRGVLAAVEAA